MSTKLGTPGLKAGEHVSKNAVIGACYRAGVSAAKRSTSSQ